MTYLPRFTLRDLFWLVLVSALAVGWWVDRATQAANLKMERQVMGDRIAAKHFNEMRLSGKATAAEVRLRLTLTELAKIYFGIRHLDSETQNKIQELIRNAPEPEPFESPDVHNVRDLIPD